MAGKKPPFAEDWKQFWIEYYLLIRRTTPDKLLGKGSEFKSPEDMVHYIREELRKHGLPTYDET